jgi:hypothetical protein
MATNLYANTAAASGPVALGRYEFVEEPGRLQILNSAGEHAGWLIFSTLLALGGVAGSVALLVALGAAKAWGGMLATGALALLGLWLLLRHAKGRTLCTFDRNSGKVLYRGKRPRSLSSITHLTIFAGGEPVYYYCVEFTRKQSSLVTKLVGVVPGRKDILFFGKPEEVLQAAKILATFLGVRVLGGEAGGLKVTLTGNGRDVEHLDFQSGN